ncbi:17636_t:CDS:2, partial [Dentiscutata erythropus]
MPTVFLPTSFSYASVYRDYVQACKDKYGKDVRILAESTFTNIWKLLMPSLQFMSLKTDLCETVQKERGYYNANIINAVEGGKHNPNVIGSQISFKSFSDDLQDNYESFTVRPFSFNADTPLPTIDVKPLSQKRQEELYKEITPYIDLPFHNIT